MAYEYIDTLDLHPTQIAVGFQQVKAKQKKLAKKSKEEFERYMARHPVPVILGPHGKYYMTDHHHLVCALHRLGIEKWPITIIEDYCDDHMRFWEALEHDYYVWLYDENGSPLTLDQYLHKLPKDVRHLKDDPYRSLAGIIRKLGAYEKDWTPFSEFQWANYLRRYIEIDGGDIKTKHIKHAMELARTKDASHLPGFLKFSSLAS